MKKKHLMKQLGVVKRLRAFGLACALLLTGAASVSLTACGSANQKTETAASAYDGKLELDHSMQLRYAKLFSVDYYKGGYKMLTVTNREEDTAITGKETKILMVPQGMSTPAEVSADTIVLQAPAVNMLVSSTPVTSLMNASGCLDSITQVTYDKDSWYIDEVKDAFDAKKLSYIGTYKEPDYEAIVAQAPTVAVFSTMLTSVPEVADKLKELKVPVILDQSTYEDDPLGRVEWAKFYAAMCDKEDAATQMFEAQAAYVDEISKVQATGKKVAVFYITSKGKIYVRNAGDYLAKMVELAGGEYVLSDLNKDKTGTQTMESEAFYTGVKDADYIIYVWSLGGKPATMRDFTAINPILSDIKAVKEGNVWCTTPDFFQIADTIGSMVNDIHLMLTADANTTELTYLKKLQ